MSGYEVEHSIPSEERQQQQQARRRRPDLGTFFSTLDLADTSDSRQNENSIPLPQDVSAAFQTLANAFSQMRGGGNEDHDNSELLGGLIESLMASAEHPPTQLQGVPDEFIEQLERIPKKNLKPDESCPICANPFLEDPHPLVVRLPCQTSSRHLFDLECIQPWLKLNPTCPLDRQRLLKEKTPPPPADDDEADFDDMYA